MKNASLVLNIVLLVAVAVLFYLHFSSNKKSETVKGATVTTNSGSVPKGDFRIAYFEMDSINNGFVLVKDVREELSKEEERINTRLTQMQKTYNDRLMQFQTRGQSMSSEESEKANREIVQMQQRFSTEKQQMEQEMQNKSIRKMQEVKTKVEDYLKEYNKSRGYTYILAYEPGFMFYRDSTYDITADLVKGLNERHKKK